MTEPQKHDKPF